MSLDTKLKTSNKMPYHWLEYKPDCIEDEYLFNGITLKTEPLSNNKIRKLIEWCMG